MAVRALVQVPKAVRRGEVFEVRTTLAHPMETGYRRDSGRPHAAARHRAHAGGAARRRAVFAADLHPAIAANPFVAFTLVAHAGGPLEIRWVGDNGFVHTETVTLVVT
jgi:sulfur-oxidizing protein SoxZ